MSELRPTFDHDALNRKTSAGGRGPSWQAGGSVRHSYIDRSGVAPPPRDDALLRRYMPKLYRELYGDGDGDDDDE